MRRFWRASPSLRGREFRWSLGSGCITKPTEHQAILLHKLGFFFEFCCYFAYILYSAS